MYLGAGCDPIHVIGLEKRERILSGVGGAHAR
jgi:hypothetical protein